VLVECIGETVLCPSSAGASVSLLIATGYCDCIKGGEGEGERGCKLQISVSLVLAICEFIDTQISGFIPCALLYMQSQMRLARVL
jgi:hypothetical protein